MEDLTGKLDKKNYPLVVYGAEAPRVDANGNSFDFTTNLLHLACHPSENSIARAAALSLYMVLDLPLVGTLGCEIWKTEFGCRGAGIGAEWSQRGLSTEEEFGLGGFNMDGSITKVRSKRFPEKFGKRLNSLMEEREEEANLINFSQLLE
ncbi:hypothetical protein JHK85_004503 [Glycine max]|nr:hypothetical protein JHK85_004503 [Glycine max]KAG5080263.1 hypothetical protein JHK86_004328 [Glycine max]